MKNKDIVRVYIEGGSSGKGADGEFRKGWNLFLKDLRALAIANGFHTLDVVRGKGRSTAYRLFKNSHRTYPNDLCVLLVDAEERYDGDKQVWDVVAQRKGDKWKKPDWATEEHLYLMKVTIETWLLTDQDALKTFFGRDFKTSVLPTTELENREKDEIDEALNKASQPCKKKSYKHGYAHQIIGLVKPENVKTLSHGQRFFDGLSALIKAYNK